MKLSPVNEAAYVPELLERQRSYCETILTGKAARDN